MVPSDSALCNRMVNSIALLYTALAYSIMVISSLSIGGDTRPNKTSMYSSISLRNSDSGGIPLFILKERNKVCWLVAPVTDFGIRTRVEDCTRLIFTFGESFREVFVVNRIV